MKYTPPESTDVFFSKEEQRSLEEIRREIEGRVRTAPVGEFVRLCRYHISDRVSCRIVGELIESGWVGVSFYRNGYEVWFSLGFKGYKGGLMTCRMGMFTIPQP